MIIIIDYRIVYVPNAEIQPHSPLSFHARLYDGGLYHPIWNGFPFLTTILMRERKSASRRFREMRNRIEERAVQQGGRLNRPKTSERRGWFVHKFRCPELSIKYLRLSQIQRLIISLSVNKQRVLIIYDMQKKTLWDDDISHFRTSPVAVWKAVL